MSLAVITNYLDFFAQPVNFSYRSNNNFKTNCGGITTIIIFLILLGFFTVLVNDMIFQLIPIVNSVHYISEEPDLIKIISNRNTSDISLANDLNNNSAYWRISIGISLNNGLITLNQTLLNLKVYQNSVKNGIIISSSLDTILCQNFGHLNNSDSEFINLSLNTTYCIDNNFFVGGVQGSEGSSWLSLEISGCTGLNCASQSDILSYVSKLQFEFYYKVEQLFFELTGDQVVGYSVGQVYFDNVPTLAKIFNSEIGFDELDSYDNYLPDFLFPIYNKYKALVVRSSKTDLINLGSDNVFLQINILPSRLKILYIRRFNDFLTQISKLGGLITVFFIMGHLMSFLYVNFEMAETMMNDFYDVIDPKNNSIFKQTFDEFIRKQYNYLIMLYCIKNNILGNAGNIIEKRKSLDLLKIKTKNNFESLKKFSTSYTGVMPWSDENKARVENESKIIEIEEIEEIDESVFEDDEGLFEFEEEMQNSKKNGIIEESQKFSKFQNVNLLKRFFTLKRIEGMYNVNGFERDQIINELKMKNSFRNQIYNFFDTIFEGKKETKIYYANKMFYDSLKYMGCRTMSFSMGEMLKIIYCPSKIKKTNKNNKYDRDIFKEKHDIYEASLEKLGMDFDLISVLKSVRELKKFKNIYFDKNQRKIFSSINKNVIILTKEEIASLSDSSKKSKDTTSQDKLILNSMKDYYKIIFNILKRGSVSPLERKMFNIIGISPENIKLLCKAAEAKVVPKKEKIENSNEKEIDEDSYEKDSQINSINKIEFENEK